MTRPLGQLGSVETLTLLALIRIQERREWPTVARVAREAGVAKSTAHLALRRLHEEGLVTYPPGLAGALRSRVRRVLIGGGP